MVTTTINPIFCAVCGTPINEPANTLPANRKQCPSCGSLARIFRVHMYGALTFREKIGLKHKRPEHKKPIYESVSGDDLHRATGRWNKLTREIDRENNRYKEIIINPASGEVVHQCDEPLTEHICRGSAKPKHS